MTSDTDFTQCKTLEDESEELCLFCRVALSPEIKIDIQYSTTEQGCINVEEFIKESVLGIHTEVTLKGQFLCDLCYQSLNSLEDYLLKSKQLQAKLLAAYLQGRKEKQEDVHVKDEPKEHSIETFEIITQSASDDNDEPMDDDDEDDDYEVDTKTKAKRNTRQRTKTLGVKRQRQSGKRRGKSKALPEEDDEGNNHADGATKPQEKQQKEQKHCCEICGKVTNKGNAAKHMNIHTKKQLFICEYCNKNFTQKVDLRRHLNIHMGIFPYVCEFCGKKFAQHTSYDIHKKNHLGKRDFKCIICDKGLLSKSHLVRHMKTHTSEKNYSCDICGKTFAEKYNRTSHMKKVHMKEPSKSHHRVECNAILKTE